MRSNCAAPAPALQAGMVCGSELWGARRAVVNQAEFRAPGELRRHSNSCVDFQKAVSMSEELQVRPESYRGDRRSIGAPGELQVRPKSYGAPRELYGCPESYRALKELYGVR